MPEALVAISSLDRYSTAIKNMSQVTKAFSKDAERMEGILDKLNKNKYTLNLDLKKAQQQLERAEKQFKKTGKASDELKLDAARVNFDNIQRNLDLVTKGARAAEQQMQKTGNAFRGTERQLGGTDTKSIFSTLINTGAAKMVSETAIEVANAFVGSAMGDDAGTLFSSALSSAISGASIGRLIPLPGATVAGAVIGGGLGLISGGAQVFQKQDDAFKGYVQGQYNSFQERGASALADGSSVAANREVDLTSFSTMFQDPDGAERYLEALTKMARDTPLPYEELTAMTTAMSRLGYGSEEILPFLRIIGDTGMALGMSGEDRAAVAQALGNMRSGGKVTEENLSALSSRGIGTAEILSDAFGTGWRMEQTDGRAAADAIVTALSKSMADGGYAGAMEGQSETFAGRSATLKEWEQEIHSAQGSGYNIARGEGLTRQNEFYEGIAQSMAEMNGIIGESKAYLENLSEQYGREAMSALLDGVQTSLYEPEQAEKLQQMNQEYVSLLDQYQDGNEEEKAVIGAKIEALKGQAESMAESAYNASTGMQEVKDVQLELIAAIRENTSALGNGAWKNAYDISQENSKGMASVRAANAKNVITDTSGGAQTWRSTRGFTPAAVGLHTVPYDNFPALLHQGERVLTASEARAQDSGGGGGVQVTVSGNAFSVRDESDIQNIAQALAEEIQLRLLAGPM